MWFEISLLYDDWLFELWCYLLIVIVVCWRKLIIYRRCIVLIIFEDVLNFVYLLCICIINLCVGVNMSVVGFFCELFWWDVRCRKVGMRYFRVFLDFVFVIVIIFLFCIVIGYDWVWMGVGDEKLVFWSC